MIITFFRDLFHKDPGELVMDAEYEPYRAKLDPYDFIFLACG